MFILKSALDLTLQGTKQMLEIPISQVSWRYTLKYIFEDCMDSVLSSIRKINRGVLGTEGSTIRISKSIINVLINLPIPIYGILEGCSTKGFN